MIQPELRNDWSKTEVLAIFDLPFMDLLYQAHTIHRMHFNPNAIQKSKNFSIKTGMCPEDCKYCSQSGHYKTTIERHQLLSKEQVIAEAIKAKANGADRFCMGAAWRNPPKKAMPVLVEIIKAVNDLGLETCATLGMLDKQQAAELAEAGLAYYNHNLDTSPEHYSNITTTRTYSERLDTLATVRDAGMKVCCGGILGIGDSREDRAGLLHQLATLSEHPQSVPINTLVKIAGTPLENAESVTAIEWIRTIAVARILMPKSFVRLSAGRNSLSDEAQAMAFFAGANSIFVGDKLLTTANPEYKDDSALFKQLGLVEYIHAEANFDKVT